MHTLPEGHTPITSPRSRKVQAANRRTAEKSPWIKETAVLDGNSNVRCDQYGRGFAMLHYDTMPQFEWSSALRDFHNESLRQLPETWRYGIRAQKVWRGIHRFRISLDSQKLGRIPERGRSRGVSNRSQPWCLFKSRFRSTFGYRRSAMASRRMTTPSSFESTSTGAMRRSS
jgi:hypothetical protein